VVVGALDGRTTADGLAGGGVVSWQAARTIAPTTMSESGLTD